MDTLIDPARRKMTFEQAEGRACLPVQLELKQLSDPLRARIWRTFYDSITSEEVPDYDGHLLGSLWKKLLYDYHTLHLHLPADEFSEYSAAHADDIKNKVMYGDYVEVLGFVEYVARRNFKLRESLSWALSSSLAAYRLHADGFVLPYASEHEGAALEEAITASGRAGLTGARGHLIKAASAASAGQYAECVRESIHAVEAAARVLYPSAKTLDPALKRLVETTGIHPAMQKGFSALYGYTSDEGGIRHAMLEGERPRVDETDAIYMLGACAAFVTYLSRKAAR